jgi:hypothetical protein
MSNNSALDTYAAKLNSRMWTTKGSRFNAARRLNKKYQFSLTSISVLSIYGILIPLLQGLLKNIQCQKVNDIYNFISLFLSVFTLVISLLEGAKNYQIRAEKLHQNAIEISTLQRELEYLFVSDSTNPDLIKKVGEISDRYENVVKDCKENHESEDYTLFTTQHRKEFNVSRIQGFFIRLKLIIIDYWLYIFVLGIPPIISLLYSSC